MAKEESASTGVSSSLTFKDTPLAAVGRVVRRGGAQRHSAVRRTDGEPKWGSGIGNGKEGRNQEILQKQNGQCLMGKESRKGDSQVSNLG